MRMPTKPGLPTGAYVTNRAAAEFAMIRSAYLVCEPKARCRAIAKLLDEATIGPVRLRT